MTSPNNRPPAVPQTDRHDRCFASSIAPRDRNPAKAGSAVSRYDAPTAEICGSSWSSPSKRRFKKCLSIALRILDRLEAARLQKIVHRDKKFKHHPFRTRVWPSAPVWVLCQVRQQFGAGVPSVADFPSGAMQASKGRLRSGRPPFNRARGCLQLSAHTRPGLAEGRVPRHRK